MFQPKPGVVLLTPSKVENKTDSGIILAGGVSQSPRGIVKYIHEDTARELNLKAGDEVVYQQYGVFPMQLGAESLMALAANDILGVMVHE